MGALVEEASAFKTMVSARSEARATQELALGIYGFWAQDSKP